MPDRFSPTGTLYSFHLHVDHLSQSFGMSREGVERVRADYASTGVHVGVCGTAVDPPHPEWADRINSDTRVTPLAATHDVSGINRVENHGISVAGTIVAGANGFGTVGLALGPRMTSSPVSPAVRTVATCANCTPALAARRALPVAGMRRSSRTGRREC